MFVFAIEDIVGRVFSDSVRLLPPIYLIVGMIQNLLFVRPTACSLAKFGGSYTITGKVGAPTITG